ncbi:MAG: hypothetical protein ABI855_05390, partial [Bacteroidota bacterium]
MEWVAKKELLYFYVSGNNISNDKNARQQFEARNTNAYGDFYKLIVNNNAVFEISGEKSKMINLLHEPLRGLKKTYRSKFNLDETEKIPLNICFVPGIDEKAKKSITDYLQGNEFEIEIELSYIEGFLNILKQKAILKDNCTIAIIESWFDDLHFHYVEYNQNISKYATKILTGKGSDHRINNLARLMVEKAAKRNHSSILDESNKVYLEQEIRNFYSRALEEIKNFDEKELITDISLSEGTSARVKIHSDELDVMSERSIEFIREKFDSFITQQTGKE